jgi:F-type H+-transporting ATPase subunit gamma
LATVQDLKRRIRSIRNSSKITKAMELVASARLRRAQARIEAMRPYADRMLELMVGTAQKAASVHGLPLLQRREVQTVGILVLTGDRGLAGAFNAQVLRQAFALERSLTAEGKQVRWLVSGKKGASTLRFRRYELEQAWQGFSDRPAYHDAQAIAHRLTQLYVEETIDRAVLVYNHFESALVQKVVEQDVLPVPEHVLESQTYEEIEPGSAARRPDLRAGTGGDPDPAAAGLRRDGGLPCPPRIGRLRAGRAHDGDAERLEERGRVDRQSDTRDEPRAAGGDHAGDPRGRRRSGRAHRVTTHVLSGPKVVWSPANSGREPAAT